MTSQTPIIEVCFVSTNPDYQGHVNYRALLMPEVTEWWVRHMSPFLFFFFFFFSIILFRIWVFLT